MHGATALWRLQQAAYFNAESVLERLASWKEFTGQGASGIRHIVSLKPVAFPFSALVLFIENQFATNRDLESENRQISSERDLEKGWHCRLAGDNELNAVMNLTPADTEP